MIICVYGDSVSFPRSSAGVFAEDTYPALIHKSLGGVLYNRSLGGGYGDIGGLFRLYEIDSAYFRPMRGDLLVIQCGVLDCKPCSFRKYLGRVFRGWDFGLILERWLKRATVDFKRVCVVGIPSTTEQANVTFGGLSMRIKAYNGIMSNIVRNSGAAFVDVGDILAEVDGIHLTKEGHMEYARRILDGYQDALGACY